MKTHIRSIELLEARIAPATFTVTTNANGGAGSLGEAIVNAANSMGTDTILFNLPAGQLTMTLPGFTIDHPVIFDGRSQPGYVDSPLVVLQGAEFGQRGFRFVNGAGGSQVLGMKITDFDESGILIDTADITVAGCDIVGNSVGIDVGGSDTTIGGMGVAGRNVISGNTQYGIYAAFGSNLTVQNAHIGVNREGTAALGNTGSGIFVDGFDSVTIGGAEKNVISGNGTGGIEFVNTFGTNNVFNSWIGVFADGGFSAASRNGFGGIRAFNAGNLTIGQNGAAPNYIANNGGPAIDVDTTEAMSSPRAVIEGNTIGYVLQGMMLVPASNQGGIRANGPTFGDATISIGGFGSAGNTIYNANGAGISASPGVTIEGNSFVAGMGLPIDINSDGTSSNDAGDTDGVQNFPTLGGVAVVSQMNQYFLTATLDSRPNESFTLKMYGFNGVQYIFLGEHSIQTDGSGHGTFNDFTFSFAGYTHVAATVTEELTRHTSELSALAPVAPGIGFVGNNSVSQIEGNTGFQILTFNVITTATPTGSINLNLAPDPASTATSGADYSFSPSTINFSPTNTSQVVSVIVSADTAVEPEEFVRLVLGNLTGNAVIVAPSVTVNIGNDDTSLKISPDSKTATWIDADGDLVTLKTTKPVLNSGMFAMNATGTLGGELLQSIDFNFANGNPKGTNLALTAKFDKARNRGDGIVDVGTIFAGGTDLGIVKLDGDLGRIEVGDGTLTDGAIKSLTVGSIGNLGGVVSSSNIAGKIGALTVRGDIVNTTIFVTPGMSTDVAAGSIGTLTISGSLIKGNDSVARISTTGSIGTVKIGGSILGDDGMFGSGIQSGGSISAVTIGGSIRSSERVAPNTLAGIEAGTTLGKVTVGGDLHYARILALGKAQPAKAADALALASLTIKGRVADSFIAAGLSSDGLKNPDAQIGTITVNGDWVRSTATAAVSAGADLVFGTADDAVVASTAAFTNNTAIVSRIAAVFVKGQIFGTSGGADSYGFVAQTIGKFGRGPAAYTLKANPVPNAAPLDLVSLSITGDVFLREVL